METKMLYGCSYSPDSKHFIGSTITIPAQSLEEAKARLNACSQGRVAHNLSNAWNTPIFACEYQYEDEQCGIGIPAKTFQEAEAKLRAIADAVVLIVYDLPCPISLPKYATPGDVLHILTDLHEAGYLVRIRTCGHAICLPRQS